MYSMSAPPVRVTMLVRNPFTNDSRVEREARSLTRAGYSVTVVAEARPGLAEFEVRAMAHVKRIRRRGPNVPGLRFVLYRELLRRAVEQTRPQILHAHDADALQSVGPAAGRLRVPFLYDSHELWLARSRRGRSWLYDRLAVLYWWLIERRYVPRAAAVIVANPPVAPELTRRYGVEVVAVPNYPEKSRDRVHREIRSLPGGDRVPGAAPIILYLGGIMPDRGIEQVLHALSKLPSGHFVCLGSGPDDFRASLNREARERGVVDRFHLLPAVPPEEVVAYSRSATVGVSVVQPYPLSYRLALPNKVFQYMAAGVPVVASDFPHLREVVEGSEAGNVVDPTDPEAIANALRRYLSDPAAARAAGARGRLAVEERYHWDVAAQALLDRYQSIRPAEVVG